MGRLFRRTSIMVALALAAFGASPTRAAQPVDLLLVLAADVSRSIDSQKFQLQREGYAAALANPRVLEAIEQVVKTCKENKIPVGHPHVDSTNVERILGEGFNLLLAAPVRSHAALDKGRQLAGRK